MQPDQGAASYSPSAYPPAPPSPFIRWAKWLVGCGLIIVLLAVLAGAGLSKFFASRRGTLQALTCSSSLRGAYSGMQIYAQDYDDALPRSAGWMDTLAPYARSRTDFICPVVRVTRPGSFGYAYNSGAAGKKLHAIRVPQSLPLVYDSSSLGRNAVDSFTTLPSPGRHSMPGSRSAEGKTTGNLIIYADGHVRFVSADGSAVDITKLNIRRSLFGGPRRRRIGAPPGPPP